MKWKFRFPSYVNEMDVHSTDGVFFFRHTYLLSPISYWFIRWIHGQKKLEDMAERNWARSNMSVPCGELLKNKSENKAAGYGTDEPSRDSSSGPAVKYCKGCDQTWPDYRSWHDHNCRPK